jgi:DNA-binding Lrp family transcriptional regulator
LAADGPGLAVQIDETDLAILRLLAEDARLSGRKLAQRVGMSAPSVTERIARLERSGVIRGYRAEIDRAVLGYPLVVHIGLVAVQGANQEEVVRTLAAMPEVEDVHVVTGPKDLLVRLRLKDHRHLRDVLFEGIWNVRGVERTETYISLAGMEPKAFDAELLTRMLEDGAVWQRAATDR